MGEFQQHNVEWKKAKSYWVSHSFHIIQKLGKVNIQIIYLCGTLYRKATECWRKNSWDTIYLLAMQRRWTESGEKHRENGHRMENATQVNGWWRAHQDWLYYLLYFTTTSKLHQSFISENLKMLMTWTRYNLFKKHYGNNTKSTKIF